MYKYFNFPVGHPVIHVGDACKDKEACLHMDCQIKCSIVTPERLYHRLLPFRANQKLMFCLCRTCDITSSTGEYCHTTVEERVMTFFWIMDEVRQAVEKGFRILEFY